MFVVILFLLGVCFGFAARMPWALLAFLVPLGLTLAASDRSAAAILVGFVVTGIGITGGLVLSSRTEHRGNPVGGA
jgi:hypothetical protein